MQREDPEPIDILNPNFQNLVEWLNLGEPASLSARSIVLMQRYLRDWRDLLVEPRGGTDRITKLSSEGVAELLWHYFPKQTRASMGKQRKG